MAKYLPIVFLKHTIKLNKIIKNKQIELVVILFQKIKIKSFNYNYLKKFLIFLNIIISKIIINN